ncbi:DUF5681 domain-containing protein [Sphingomonas sp. IC4-52]|uniref:DUF5681 domain-containing protein n=1 Tax=Sphingomonas sp. IC4-52 TaxID=2887202 RepID=UPI001D11CCEB|nr:DUF5681 domain-containing protein [Sphingomonas sp. IC4-52]MCC2980795.1 DUF5681 domain-containing protein [Sphingomonas sp. IC4-52]
MGQYDDRDYKVGKGKPPIEHRFKKGRSGNPKGPRHKKKAKDATLEVLAFEAVNEMVTVVIAGRERRITKKQAILLGVVNDALTGTPAQRLKAVKELREIGAFAPTVEDQRLTPEMRDERARQFIDRLIEAGKRTESMQELFKDYE